MPNPPTNPESQPVTFAGLRPDARRSAAPARRRAGEAPRRGAVPSPPTLRRQHAQRRRHRDGGGTAGRWHGRSALQLPRRRRERGHFLAGRRRGRRRYGRRGLPCPARPRGDYPRGRGGLLVRRVDRAGGQQAQRHHPGGGVDSLPHGRLHRDWAWTSCFSPSCSCAASSTTTSRSNTSAFCPGGSWSRRKCTCSTALTTSFGGHEKRTSASSPRRSCPGGWATAPPATWADSKPRAEVECVRPR